MGVKGLFSCLKSFAVPINYKLETPIRLALDAYPFLYKFRENITGCLELFNDLRSAGHSLSIFVDGTPPKEKLEELAHRRAQKEIAYQQAKALKLFLEDEERSSQLGEDAKEILHKQIASYELVSWSIGRSLRETFIQACAEKNIPLIFCKGESDQELVQASLRNEFDAIVANDMDLFVGGVERLWVLGKTQSDPLFLEFRRSVISKHLAIHPDRWADVALLTGYEKCPTLKRLSAQQAIVHIRNYGSLETFFEKRPDLLGENTIEQYQKGREYFQ